MEVFENQRMIECVSTILFFVVSKDRVVLERCCFQPLHGRSSYTHLFFLFSELRDKDRRNDHKRNAREMWVRIVWNDVGGVHLHWRHFIFTEFESVGCWVYFQNFSIQSEQTIHNEKNSDGSVACVQCSTKFHVRTLPNVQWILYKSRAVNLVSIWSIN